MGGCIVRGVMTSMDLRWIITVSLQMTHHLLTSLAISFLLLTTFITHLTQVAVITHYFCFSIRACSSLSAHLKPKSFLQSLFSAARVLVHCAVGVSRSASLVLAYLMIHHHYKLLEAINKVKEHRWIFPNRGFLKQLCALDMKLQQPSYKTWTV